MSSNGWGIALLSAASPILGGVYARMQQGKLEAQAAVDKAQAAKIEGQVHKLQATQAAELSRQQLYQTLGAIDVIRSGRGLSGDSATAQALERNTIQNAYRNEAVQVLGSLNAQQASLWQAAGYNRAAKWAIPLAAVEAGSNAGKQIMSAMMSGGGGGGG